MEGNNTLILCKAEMMRIVESHLNSVLKDGSIHEVSNIRYNSSDYVFLVDFKKPEEKKK